MGRKNSKQTRYDAMQQRDQRWYDKKKKFGGRRKDNNLWGNRMMKKLEELKADGIGE
jgi:hypothetical protein